MALDTYSSLKTALAAWSARTDLETGGAQASYLDDFIDLAEDMHKTPPVAVDSPILGGVRGNITRATGTLTAGTATLSLPSDFLELDRIVLTADMTTLRFMDATQLKERATVGSSKPSVFTIADVIEFDCPPDSGYAYELKYWPQFSALSSTQTTNWLLTNFPRCYLTACMYWLSKFNQDDAGEERWGAAYKSAAWSANESYRRGRYSRGPIQTVPDTSTP